MYFGFPVKLQNVFYQFQKINRWGVFQLWLFLWKFNR